MLRGEGGSISHSWLYDRRDQLDGYEPYAEIAYRFRPKVLPQDRDDIEVEIILRLKEIADSHTEELSPAFLWTCARHIVIDYWRKKRREAKRFCRLYEGDGGEMAAGSWQIVSCDPDIDAKIDAEAQLQTLPKRLIEVGTKRVEGERLNNADKLYLSRKRRRPSESYHHSTKEEVELMRHLYVDEGLCSAEVARIVGKSRMTVQRAMNKLGVMRYRNDQAKVPSLKGGDIQRKEEQPALFDF
jgi:DNA-directed RNA polymerase specialized sigma24 family protein